MRAFQARGVISREKPITDCTYVLIASKYSRLRYLFDSPLPGWGKTAKFAGLACSRLRDSRVRWIEKAQTAKIKLRVPFSFASSPLSESLEQALEQANICRLIYASRLSRPHQACIETLNFLDIIHHVCKHKKIIPIPVVAQWLWNLVI